jgi:hypothetical protein
MGYGRMCMFFGAGIIKAVVKDLQQAWEALPTLSDPTSSR